MHDGPVIAAAIVRGVPYTAGVDGRVIRWTDDLRVDAVVRQDAENPVHSLAACDGALLGLHARGLIDWGADTTSELPALDHLVVRGERAFAVAEIAVVVLERKQDKWRVTGEVPRAPGTAIDFDVDEAGKFALVIRHPNRVEVLDLARARASARGGGRARTSFARASGRRRISCS